MIISHKEFPNFKRYEMDYCGRPFFMEVGKMAELCNASVLVGYGDTRVLVTATASARPKDGIDYFPLAVDFNEKLYAVGRIPGSFNRREGRPSLNAVLASRLIDRPMRPLFPSDLRNDVVIACEVLAVDRDCSPEVAAMIGASTAVSIICASTILIWSCHGNLQCILYFDIFIGKYLNCQFLCCFSSIYCQHGFLTAC